MRDRRATAADIPSTFGARAILGVVVFLLAAPGCSYVNRPLNSLTVPLEARAKNNTRAAIGAELIPQEARDNRQLRPATGPEQSATRPDGVDADGYFVGLAMSGGGSRSANFAAAAMFQLQRLGFLQRVDYISAVSGGSLPAAYYCTHDQDAWNPQNVQRKLSHSFANDVIVQTLLPWNTFALAFTSVDRTDLLSDSFTSTLFSRGGRALTYADLRADRPRLLLNATDLQSGKRFVFCNESFDEINTDLSKYPIARAVAGSSAVPVLLHQLTIKDYSTTFDQYRHVIDGGVADNLGAETLIETFAAHVEQARARGEPDPYPNGAVLVFLDATVEFDARLSDKADINFLDSLIAGAGLSTTSLLNRASSATMAKIIVQNAPDDSTARELRGYIRELADSGHLKLKDRTGHPVEVVHIALSRVDSLSDVPFMSFSESVNNISTYFNIDRTEAFHLYKAAELLVKQKHEPALQKLLDRMEAGERNRD
jgi:predicted acylesterase/phospholipase RssA